MTSLKCYVVFCVSAILLTGNLCFAVETKDVSGVQLVLRNPPQTAVHCIPYTMTIEASFDNPAVRKEVRKRDVVWNLDRVGQHFNPAANTFESQTTGFGTHIIPQGVISGTFDPTWTVYKYRRTVATSFPLPLTSVGDGSNTYKFYSHFVRGSYFKVPGKWKIIYTATMAAADKNNADKMYRSWDTKDFQTEVEGPKLKIYAIEGLGGAIPCLDHLNQNIVQHLTNEPECQWTYKHLYMQNNVFNLIFESIENQIYMDSDCGCNKLALVGYSNGGHEVLKIAETVGQSGGFSPTFTSITEHLGKVYPKRTIQIDLLFTIDPVKQAVSPNGGYGFTKPENVTTAINFFQQVDVGSLLGTTSIYGDSIAGAANTQLSNNDFETPQGAHIKITNINAVRTSLKNALTATKP
jgi:hypothetical protein